MLSHYTTSAVLPPDAKELNPVFGPPVKSEPRDLKTSILHFPERWAGRTPPICPELGRWMDRSHAGEQGRREDERIRRRERGQIEGKGREEIGRTQGWGSIVNSRVGSSRRCSLHPRVYKLQRPTTRKGEQREREGGRKARRADGGWVRGLLIIEWADVVSLRDFMWHRPCHALPHRAHRYSQKCARVMLSWIRVPQKCGSFEDDQRWFTSCLTLPLCAWIVRLVHFISRTMCETYIEKENQPGASRRKGASNLFYGKNFARNKWNLLIHHHYCHKYLK